MCEVWRVWGETIEAGNLGMSFVRWVQDNISSKAEIFNPIISESVEGPRRPGTHDQCQGERPETMAVLPHAPRRAGSSGNQNGVGQLHPRRTIVATSDEQTARQLAWWRYAPGAAGTHRVHREGTGNCAFHQNPADRTGEFHRFEAQPGREVTNQLRTAGVDRPVPLPPRSLSPWEESPEPSEEESRRYGGARQESDPSNGW